MWFSWAVKVQVIGRKLRLILLLRSGSLVGRASFKGLGSVQVYWHRFESQLWYKVVGKNPGRANWPKPSDISARIGNVAKYLQLNCIWSSFYNNEPWLLFHPRTLCSKKNPKLVFVSENCFCPEPIRFSVPVFGIGIGIGQTRVGGIFYSSDCFFFSSS